MASARHHMQWRDSSRPNIEDGFAEHRNAIATAVSQHAGREIILEYFLAEPVSEPKKAETSGNKPSRIQRMREIETNELVKSCIEHFNAEIVRIDRVN